MKSGSPTAHLILSSRPVPGQFVANAVPDGEHRRRTAASSKPAHRRTIKHDGRPRRRLFDPRLLPAALYFGELLSQAALVGAWPGDDEGRRAHFDQPRKRKAMASRARGRRAAANRRIERVAGRQEPALAFVGHNNSSWKAPCVAHR